MSSPSRKKIQDALVPEILCRPLKEISYSSWIELSSVYYILIILNVLFSQTECHQHILSLHKFCKLNTTGVIGDIFLMFVLLNVFVVSVVLCDFSKVKEEINKIIQRAQGSEPGGFGDNSGNIEISIPGNKVGLVIGKGGETIKQLQVSSYP